MYGCVNVMCRFYTCTSRRFVDVVDYFHCYARNCFVLIVLGYQCVKLNFFCHLADLLTVRCGPKWAGDLCLRTALL